MSNKKYPWEVLDTKYLSSEKDILVYHIYSYLNGNSKRPEKSVKNDLKIISSYLTKEKLKEMGVGSCSRTK